MTITRILVSIASFSFAMIAGFKTAMQVNPIEEIITYSMDADTMPGVPIPNNGQFNLLIIGVDDIKNPEANLQSVWLFAFPPDSAKISVMPIFPSLKTPVQNLILAETFHLHNGKPTPAFWNVMKANDFWWNEFTVSDEAGLIKLIDSVGGINVDGSQFNGDQAAGVIPAWKTDPPSALNQQKVVFESVCNQIIQTRAINSEMDLNISLKHLNLSESTISVIADWISEVAAHTKPSCYFPSFDEIPAQATAVSP